MTIIQHSPAPLSPRRNSKYSRPRVGWRAAASGGMNSGAGSAHPLQSLVGTFREAREPVKLAVARNDDAATDAANVALADATVRFRAAIIDRAGKPSGRTDEEGRQISNHMVFIGGSVFVVVGRDVIEFEDLGHESA